MRSDNPAISDHDREAPFLEHALTRARRHRGFVVIETGGGFYGENFLHQLLDSFGAGSAIELLDPDDPEVGMAPAVAVIRAPLVSGLRGWRDVVTARAAEGSTTIVVLPPGVDGDIMRREPVPALVLSGAELTYSRNDVGWLVAEALALRSADRGAEPSLVDGIAEVITQFSEGWPASVHACVNHLRSCEQPAAAPSVFGQRSFRAKVVAPYLEPFGDQDVSRMAQIAHFSSVTPQVAAAIGGLDFSETKLPHAPGLLRTTSGLVRFIGPVRRHLTELHPLQPATAELVAPVLAAEGLVTMSATTLMAAGLHEMAAELIESIDDAVIDRTDQREMLGIVKDLQERLGVDRPSLALKLARVHWNLSEISESIRVCDEALDMTEEESPAWLEVAIERLWYRHLSMDAERAAAEILRYRGLLGRIGASSAPTAAVRLREVEAYVLAQSREAAIVERSVNVFEEVAASWLRNGEPLRAARTLRNLASVPLHHLGRYREAQTVLERAGTLCLEQAYDYAITMLTKARFDAMCADREAFRLSEHRARHLTDGAESGPHLGHLMLARAIDAAWEHDPIEVDRCFRLARSAFGPDLAPALVVLLHATVAEALAVAGDCSAASRLLDDVRAQADACPIDFAHAELIVAARCGRLDLAEERLRVLTVSESGLPNDRRWRAQLEMQLARGGDAEHGIVTAAQREAARLGLGRLLAALAPDLSGGADQGLTPAAAVRIEVLGRFLVTQSGMPVSMKRWSKAGQLLTLLIMSGGRVTVAEAADELWPESTVGVKRLKNVLSSIRRDVGADVVVRTDKTIALTSNVTSDVADFVDSARMAVAMKSVDPAAARQSAVEALGLCRGPIIAADATERVAEFRTSLAAQADSLLSYLAESHHVHQSWLVTTQARLWPKRRA